MTSSKFENQDTEKTSKETTDKEIQHIKHPLQNSWSLWYYDNDRKKSWLENLKEITSFATVEDFWSIYNHIKPASELKISNDYYLFKTGISPTWEDKANEHGGRWVMSIDKKQRDYELDSIWLEVMLCLIGESFEEHTDEICGATVNIRAKVDRISVWTAHSDKPTAMAIGRILKDRLNLNGKQLTFSVHPEAVTKSGATGSKNISYVI
ncbi:eukaryotic translation initiation factor 4E-like isoform X1 [Cimex lectularius]|uniref:eIF-4F 25 kDa subunit n=1 Tax=Cimex lectularius TaxID=79782 RepID=A0A8I6SI63_CIMLE|nr:eukaryotic translation initiation factor 4E-like isoform X1 [Cimex lectularius]